jgi:hypothetical protein
MNDSFTTSESGMQSQSDGTLPPVPPVLLIPTPMNQLSKQAERRADLEYVDDCNGEMSVIFRPTCNSYAMMMPFPFFCVGCCTSISSNITFHDSSQTLTISTCPGLCFIAQKTEVVEYHQVANIGFIRSNRSQGKGGLQLYWPSIILKDERRIYIGDMETLAAEILGRQTLQAKILAMHAYLFGRGNPHYTKPSIGELTLQ